MKTKFWLSFLTSISLVFTTQTSRAQTYQPSNRIPVADSSLGTQVSGNGNNFNITGGINKGQTLFHSFTDFSVPTNGAANFLNPANNRDIITRVTGTVFSDINGLLNTNGANFFLINPNGIVFGTNARLNVGKAFVGSTANGIDLVDAGGRMITFGTNPNGDAPLLSVAPNVLFNAARLNFSGSTGSITNFGTLQTPNNSQYIGLIGGNVTLNGSTGGGKIVAPGGRVDIGGLSGAGSVTVDNNGLVFSSVGVGRSNVVLTDGAGITVRATGTLDTVNTFFNNASSNGSSININANNLTLLNAGENSATLPAAIDAGLETNSGVQTKAAGNINIDATNKVSLNNSNIKNTLRDGAEGSIGDIKIQVGTLDVNNSSLISTVTAGKGNAGNVSVIAKDTVLIANNSSINSSVYAGGIGNGGSLDLNSGSLSLTNGARLTASTYGTGNAGNVTVTAKDAVSLAGQPTAIFSTVEAGGVGKGGNIEINAGSLSLTNGAQLDTITRGASATQPAGMGDAGNVTVKVSGAVDIAGIDGTFPSGIRSTVDTKTKGNSGNITIDAGSLSLRDGAQLVASNFGTGNAGNVTVTAKDAVSIVGGNIFSTIGAGAIGKGGNITIDAGSVSVRDSAELTASTFGTGNAGNVSVTAKDNVSLTGNSYIFSTVEAGGVGKGGSIKINAGALSITDGARLLTSTRSASATQPAGIGDAGDVTVKVSGAVDITGFGGTFYGGIRSEVGTGAKGNGGNISIQAGSLSLREGAEIAASTFGTGNAGGVTLTAKNAISMTSYSYVLSKVEAGGVGNGGNIAIDAGALSLQDSAKLNTITLGTGNAGNVNVKVTGAVDISALNYEEFPSGFLSYVDTKAKGNGGNITVDAGAFSMRDGARLRASTYGTGNAGNITVIAKDAISLAGNSYILSTVESGGVGKGGTIDINSGSLSLKDGAQLLAITREASTTQPAGIGDAGNVTVKVSGAVDIAGISGTFPSGIRSAVGTGAKGTGGNITIDAGSLSLRDGGELSASTAGTGNAGNVMVMAKDVVSLVGNSYIFSTVKAGGVGKGGTIDINAASLSLTNGAQLLTSTLEASNTQPAGIGDAGNITIKVSGVVDITGTGTFSSSIFSDVETGTKGNGGNIAITAGSFSLRDGAQIVASTAGTGNAGNVTVMAKDAVSLVGNSYIFSRVQAGGVGKGGTIDINAASLSLTNGAQLLTNTRGASATQAAGIGDAGNVTIKVSGAVDIAGFGGTFYGGIRSEVGTGAKGNGGNISIQAGSLSLREGAEIATSTTGTGNAGNVTVTAKDAVSLTRFSYILSGVEAGGVGNGGNVAINAGSLLLQNRAKLQASTSGMGNAGNVTVTAKDAVSVINSDIFSTLGTRAIGQGGNITIDAGSVSITNGTEIATSTYGTGNAGNVTVTAKNAVDLVGQPTAILSTVKAGAMGSAGNITVDAGSLSLRDGAQIEASTYGTGNAGNVIVTAKDTVSLTGQPTAILSTVEAGGVGKGGNIDINTGSLSLKNGGQLETITRVASATQPAGQGDAGNVTVKVSGTADIAGINGTFPSGIRSNVATGTTGNGGNISIAAGDLSLRDGAVLVGSSFGQGNAGNLLLTGGKIVLDRGAIFSQSLSYTGGNITIKNTDYLLLRNNSSISTNSDSTNFNGNGGNITIGSPLIIALPQGNSIAANANGGNGGNVNITSQGLFGIQYRPKGQATPSSNDITASSTFGQSGAVKITTPGTDPGRDSAELPKVTTDASNQISQVCGASTSQNKLTVTGRGGLPPNANDPLTSDVVWQDARAVSSQPAVSSVTTPVKFAPPAVGWVFDGKGKVTLVAAGTQGEPTGTSVVCPQ